MSLTPMITLAESSTRLAGVSKWTVGVSLFVVLLVLMGGLLAFGGGRRHS
jgi:hypothetical protein